MALAGGVRGRPWGLRAAARFKRGADASSGSDSSDLSRFRASAFDPTSNRLGLPAALALAPALDGSPCRPALSSPGVLGLAPSAGPAKLSSPRARPASGVCFAGAKHESCCWRCFPECMTRAIAAHVQASIGSNAPVQIDADAEETARFLATLHALTQSSYQFKVRRKERCAAAARSAGGEGGRELSRAAINQVDWMQQLMDGTLGS
jgi:hypothetical protein